MHFLGLCGFLGPFLQFGGSWGPQNGSVNVYHSTRDIRYADFLVQARLAITDNWLYLYLLDEF